MKAINLIEEGRLGGPQLRILRVTPKLTLLGVETTVVIPRDYSSNFQKRLTEAGIQFKTTPLTTMGKHPKRLLIYAYKFLPELFFLTRLFHKLNPDFIHVSGGSWQFKGVLAARLAGRKVIWHLNDTQTPTLIKLLFRAIHPLAHLFITAGYRVQEYYLPSEQKRPVYNISAPVDCSFFNPSLVQKIRSDDVWRVLTVSNISPVKGLGLFLQMAALLNKKNDHPLEFRVVGFVHESQRRYFDELKNLAKKLKLENINFIGGVEDVREELANASVYVCTSISEASPTSVWEALAMGCPTVTTDVGEVDYIIENAETGFVCRNDNAQELGNRVQEILNNNEISTKMGKRARSRALNLIDLNVVANQHFRAYHTLMEKNI